MKTKITSLVLASIFVGSLAFAQTVTETSTTVQQQPGVITSYDPTASVLEVRTTTGATPVRYRYTKTTTFTDSQGNVLSAEQIRSSTTPATVYYTKVGSDYVASRVVIQPAAPAAPAAPRVIEETSTTTTTTPKED